MSSLEIVGKIYDAAFDAEVWPELLSDIADYCGMENAALVTNDERLGHSSVITPRAHPDVISDYADYWWEHDPTAVATAKIPVGQLSNLNNTGREAFFASSFYNDYWRRSGLGAERIATNLFTANDGFSALVLQASPKRDRIERDAAERFRPLVPHLIRATGMARKMQRMAFESVAAMCGGVRPFAPVIIVDAERRLLFANQSAEQLIVAQRGIGVSNGRICLTDCAREAQLAAAVYACQKKDPLVVAGGRIVVKTHIHDNGLSIDIHPVNSSEILPVVPQAVAALLIEDLDAEFQQRHGLLQRRFGLTPAEAKIAMEMLVGDGRAAAASRCGVSINTARTQLSSVFEKVGVKRQAELVKVLLAQGVRH